MKDLSYFASSGVLDGQELDQSQAFRHQYLLNEVLAPVPVYLILGFEVHTLVIVMSTITGKRKRARKACIPCHQRKRKCDAEYPCGTCTTYGYNCRYADHETTGVVGGGIQAPLQAERVDVNGGDSMVSPVAAISRTPDSRSYVAQDPRGASWSTNSPTVVAGASAATTTTATTPAGIFDEHKSRYAGASAAMAFPHILGVALGSDSLPKMHSFAYNFGVRPEEASNVHGSLAKLISEDDLGFFSGVYFSVMAPIGDYIDPRIYAQRCRDYYHGSSSTAVTFGALAAGVAALGSFLSPNKYPGESRLVEYAKAILEDPASIRMLGIDYIIAGAMRVFYLRATTRPNNAWVVSCTIMHLCEAAGLHEEENIKKMASVAGAAIVGHDADRLRRIFWISWAGHNMLSYEYDRSSVRFGAVTCQAIIPIAGSVADQFVQIAQIIPSPNSPFQLECKPPTPGEELFERLRALDKLKVTHPFLIVTKADVAFCFYRRIYQLKIGIPDEIIQLVINSGNAAVEAAEQLVNQGFLFWNVIGGVFQYACILLAIDTPAASVHIAAAFKGLENLVKAADTGMTRRALSMARHLLSLNMAKKRRELAQLEAVEASYESFQAQPEPEANTGVPDMGWGDDWDQFLIEPYLSMLGPDIQLQ
ncbi:Fungal transcriptional regulatory protein, N-terminal [Penicillium camemberti]|uniref:Fungal transcriptional regulatory protein, N-terminal n=1 Tax=Penicillium camemberti (strain FM 013) TaxID=1429867 RepID=A0A0G4P6P9_PENC3|nr:Fungal transcriptional regulatory protein, N-terminal [Penicillium camemberti]